MGATLEPVWTDAKIERLRDMWAAGAKKPQIALELDVTENAITGKVYRLGLSRRREISMKAKPISVPPVIQVEKPKPEPKVTPKAESKPKPVKAPPRLEPMSKRHVPAVDSPSPKPWIERGLRECAFPLGEPSRPAEQVCCANKTMPGTAYCQGHNRMMFQERRR